MRRESSNPTFQSSVFQVPFDGFTKPTQAFLTTNSTYFGSKSTRNNPRNSRATFEPIVPLQEIAREVNARDVCTDCANNKLVQVRDSYKGNEMFESQMLESKIIEISQNQIAAEKRQKAERRRVMESVDRQNLQQLAEKRQAQSRQRQTEHTIDRERELRLINETQKMKNAEIEAKKRAHSVFANDLNAHLEIQHQLKAKEEAEEKDRIRRSVGLNLGQPREDYRGLVKKELEHQLVDKNRREQQEVL